MNPTGVMVTSQVPLLSTVNLNQSDSPLASMVRIEEFAGFVPVGGEGSVPMSTDPPEAIVPRSVAFVALLLPS